MQVIWDLMHNPGPKGQIHTISVRLVVRESTVAAPPIQER